MPVVHENPLATPTPTKKDLFAERRKQSQQEGSPKKGSPKKGEPLPSPNKLKLAAKVAERDLNHSMLLKEERMRRAELVKSMAQAQEVTNSIQHCFDTMEDRWDTLETLRDDITKQSKGLDRGLKSMKLGIQKGSENLEKFAIVDDMLGEEGIIESGTHGAMTNYLQKMEQLFQGEQFMINKKHFRDAEAYKARIEEAEVAIRKNLEETFEQKMREYSIENRMEMDFELGVATIADHLDGFNEPGHFDWGDDPVQQEFLVKKYKAATHKLRPVAQDLKELKALGKMLTNFRSKLHIPAYRYYREIAVRKQRRFSIEIFIAEEKMFRCQNTVKYQSLDFPYLQHMVNFLQTCLAEHQLCQAIFTHMDFITVFPAVMKIEVETFVCNGELHLWDLAKANSGLDAFCDTIRMWKLLSPKYIEALIIPRDDSDFEDTGCERGANMHHHSHKGVNIWQEAVDGAKREVPLLLRQVEKDVVFGTFRAGGTSKGAMSYHNEEEVGDQPLLDILINFFEDRLLFKAALLFVDMPRRIMKTGRRATVGPSALSPKILVDCVDVMRRLVFYKEEVSYALEKGCAKFEKYSEERCSFGELFLKVFQASEKVLHSLAQRKLDKDKLACALLLFNSYDFLENSFKGLGSDLAEEFAEKIAEVEQKVVRYGSVFKWQAWGAVLEALPLEGELSTQEAAKQLQAFFNSVETIHARYQVFQIANPDRRSGLRLDIEDCVIGTYAAFLEKHEAVLSDAVVPGGRNSIVQYEPDQLRALLHESMSWGEQSRKQRRQYKAFFARVKTAQVQNDFLHHAQALSQLAEESEEEEEIEDIEMPQTLATFGQYSDNNDAAISIELGVPVDASP